MTPNLCNYWEKAKERNQLDNMDPLCPTFGFDGPDRPNKSLGLVNQTLAQYHIDTNTGSTQLKLEECQSRIKNLSHTKQVLGKSIESGLPDSLSKAYWV